MGLSEAPATRGAWGILGGTFDPIHYAHLAIAEQARETLGLAGVLFVPARIPPHKPGRAISPAGQRVAMVSAAIADNPAFRLSRVEVDRPGPSYSVETLERLLAAPEPADAPARGYVLLMSVEALAGLPTWREPRRLLELAPVAALPRLGHRPPSPEWSRQHFPGQEGRIIMIDGPDLGHSASFIRRLAAEGRSIRYLVPPAVEAYIRDHRLYRPERMNPA